MLPAVACCQDIPDPDVKLQLLESTRETIEREDSSLVKCHMLQFNMLYVNELFNSGSSISVAACLQCIRNDQ